MEKITKVTQESLYAIIKFGYFILHLVSSKIFIEVEYLLSVIKAQHPQSLFLLSFIKTYAKELLPEKKKDFNFQLGNCLNSAFKFQPFMAHAIFKEIDPVYLNVKNLNSAIKYQNTLVPEILSYVTPDLTTVSIVVKHNT